MKLTRQFTRRERVLLVILALLLVFAVYFLGVHLPVSEAMERLRAESETLSAALTVLEAKRQRMDGMQQELDVILSQKDAAEIPVYDNLQRVMDFLDTVLGSAEDYTLSFQGLQKSEDSGILRREMQLSYVCPSYSAARDVLEQLQSCPFRCQIGALSLAPASRDGEPENPSLTDGPVKVSLTVTFFENAR